MPLYAKLAAIFTLIHRLMELEAPGLDKQIHQLVDDVLDMLGEWRDNFAHLQQVGDGTATFLEMDLEKKTKEQPEQIALDL